jgi:polyphosphate kinase
MATGRVLRFEPPSRAELDRLASGRLPGGLSATRTRRDFRRDIYFDTRDGDLERRGVTVRLHVSPDGERVLSVDIREKQEDSRVTRRHAEEAVSSTDPRRIFAENSEPVRLLAAMVDPERIEPQLELETRRWVRDVHSESDPRVRVTVSCDALTLRHEQLVAEMEDVEMVLPEDAAPAAEEIVGVLQEEYGLRVTLATKLARAREALERLEIGALEERVRAAREVAIIVHDEGRIALVRDASGELRVPSGIGWGERSCLHVLSSVFGRAQGKVRVLGTSSGVGARPAVEVWLAEGVAPRRSDEDSAQPDVEWWAPDALLELVGSHELRDTATLAALHMALRQALRAYDHPSWSERPASARQHPFRRGAGFVRPAAVASRAGKSAAPPAELLINMETSEIAFNERVLSLAEDRRTPLLERVRFLSIVGSNLDQFFMTRVAGFHQQVASGSTKRTLDGLTPEQQLDVIAVRARALFARAYTLLWDEMVPRLRDQEIEILQWAELGDGDREYLTENYASQLGTVLTPLAADPSHPFPHIRNLRPHLGVVVRVPETGAQHFAAMELPGDLPRFVPLPGGRRFIALEEVIASTLPVLYAGLDVRAAHTFRVTRSANFTIDEEAVGDVLQAVAEKVQKRPLGPVVRLEVEESMPDEMRQMLLRELLFETHDRVATLREEDLYPVAGLVDLFALHEIAALPLPDLHYPPLQRSSPLDPVRPIFEQMRERELLVHFPEHSFEGTVERLLVEAAKDPDVVSIRITLYRTNRSSRVVRLLRKARRRGKEVVALVELKASFDEKRNIEWARALESAGIHVVYGPPHLKVHAKLALVVRREGESLRRYFYVGTGNLNAATAAAYTDVGLLSTDPAIGEEVHEVFNGLTGYSATAEYDHLLVAPFNMRNRFLEMIDREIEHARAGRGGSIRLKVNGITDRELIASLYRASQAGVRVEMVVRGLCALRPRVPGVSENISVVSVLGRFLEHGRIYRFDNGGEAEYFIGSADWRPRNLSRRVEVATAIREPEHRAALDRILDADLTNPEAWELGPDGNYEQRSRRIQTSAEPIASRS